jgi:hypothetical protein
MTDQDIRDLYQKNPREMSEDELERILNAGDKNLLRVAQNVPEVAVLVATWRLRERIHKEERAIKLLTWVLVALTGVLVYLGFSDFMNRPAALIVRPEESQVQYDLGERCGKATAEWFKKQWGDGVSGGKITTYENHYNSKLNRCVVLLSQHAPGSVLLTLFDQNEHTTYGELDASESKLPIQCYVGEKRCACEVEWRALAKPLMQE